MRVFLKCENRSYIVLEISYAKIDSELGELCLYYNDWIIKLKIPFKYSYGILNDLYFNGIVDLRDYDFIICCDEEEDNE